MDKDKARDIIENAIHSALKHIKGSLPSNEQKNWEVKSAIYTNTSKQTRTSSFSLTSVSSFIGEGRNRSIYKGVIENLRDVSIVIKEDNLYHVCTVIAKGNFDNALDIRSEVYRRASELISASQREAILEAFEINKEGPKKTLTINIKMDKSTLAIINKSDNRYKLDKKIKKYINKLVNLEKR